MAVSDLIRSHRATRQFTQQPVPEEDIRAILNAGRRAQSSKNGQPWYFIVVQDRETLKRLSECGMYASHVAHAAFAVALVTGGTGPADEFDLGQAAAYMQLVASDRGIGSCLVAMHHGDEAKAVLNIPAEMHFRIAIDFGYPAPQEQPQAPKKSGRKTFDEVVRWGSWS